MGKGLGRGAGRGGVREGRGEEEGVGRKGEICVIGFKGNERHCQ